MKQSYLLIGLTLFALSVKSQTSYTWNGSVSTAWNTPANWTPNGVPGAADNVTIVTGANTCILNATTSINNLTLTSGTLDLGAVTLTVNGTTATFTSGTVQNGTLTIPSATTATFNGAVTVNCPTNITSAAVTLKNSTFQQNLAITKTGASNDASGGNNSFNGPATFTNAGSGYLMLGNGNPDQFNNTATFNNTGSSNLYVAYNSTGNTFGGLTTFNNTPTGNTGIYVSWNSAGTTFSGNIVAGSTNGQGVQFCGGNTTATTTLATGYTIGIAPGGFSAGTLLLRQFTQTGATAQTLTLTGTGALTYGPSSAFGGNITSSSPSLFFNGAAFNGTSAFTKTGATGDYGQGGNTFNGTCSITNSGSSYLLLGNNNPDTWNADVTFTDNGSERLLPCWASAGNQFNGNIYVNTAGSATGIQFCGGNTTATATLAATKTIQAGGTGLTAGYLYLKQFTQAGNAPINLTGTGSSVLYLGPSSSFGGPLTATAPDIWAQGATYNSAAVFNKTGGSSNHNNQNQNIFNSTCTINQQSATGYFMLGYNSNDLFNDNITLTCTAAGGIYLGWTSGTGTPTLAAGKTIQVGGAGYNAGFLSLNTFTQLGNAPINLTFTGTNTSLTLARSSVIGGNMTTSTPDLFLNGSTFNGTTNFTKTGSGGDFGQGGNTFNGTCAITNSGSSYLLLGNNNPDTWNADVTFTDNGSERLLPCWASTGNQFNGNIIVNTSGSAFGIQFCGGSATATANLAATKTIQAGSTGLNAGYLILRQFTQAGNAPINLTLASTATYLQFGPASSFGGDVVTSSPGLYFSGCTFGGIVASTKTGATNDNSSGNNIFNGVTTLTDAGSGYLLLGNGNSDQFNNTATFNNTGSANLYVAWNSSGNVFGGLTTFNNTPTANNLIYVSWNSTGTTFNNNIVVSSTNGQGVQFCGGNTTASATLSAGNGISVGPGGFSAGTLLLRQFTQLGSAPVTLTLTGTSILTYGPTSALGGAVVSSSPTLYLNGCTFNGTSSLTKTGTTGDYSAGGNTFNDVCSITNSGSSFLLLGNTNPDTWNADVTFTDNGSERLLPCWASTGNQFNGNINVNTSGSATGIQFCGGNTTASATQSAGMTVQSGGTGLTAGYLILKQFTQLGNAPVNLTLSNTATYLQFGPSSAIGGDVTSSSPGLYFNGCTFSGAVTSTKTGATNDNSSGTNVFNGVTTITNAGSGQLLLGNGNSDQFNTTATFNNTGSNNLQIAYNSPGNVFGGVTTFNNTPTANTGIYVSWYSAGTTFSNNIVTTSTNGQGVQFCGGNATATATLSAGNTISIGPGGFSSGILLLRHFTQVGATPQSLTLTGTGNLTYGPSSSFDGNVTSSSPTLLFNGCTFNGTLTSTKTGPSNDNSSGNNIFNGVANITDAATGYLLLGNGNSDQFNNTATFNNTGTSTVYLAYNSPNNIFGGVTTFNNTPSANTGIFVSSYSTGTTFTNNIVVNSTFGQGVQFCTGNATATATLNAGNTISVGATGFTAGTLLLRQFTQSGSTNQNITLTGTGTLSFGPSTTFNGPTQTSSPSLFFNGSTFNNTIGSTKTGSTNDASQGNNFFNGTSWFTDNGTGYLMMSNLLADAYNADVTFVKGGTGAVYPNYNANGTYSGNLTVTSPAASAITFGAGSGTAIFTGSGGQNIYAAAGTATPVFTRLVINNTGSGVTLFNTPINVSSQLTMTSGLLNTSMAYILTMLNGSATAPGTALSTSYVNGPMRYQKSSAGSTALNFPIGTAPDCRPVVLTVNHTNGTLYTYTAQLYDASAYALGYTMPPSVQIVSSMHYYIIGRTDASGTSQPTANLSGNQTIQIFFGANDYVTDGSTLTIVKNTYLTPTKWIDIGGTGAPPYSGGADLIGSIISTSSPTAFNSFSTFALANRIGGSNVLPMKLLYFKATPDNSQVDLTWATATEFNNAYFTVEKSKDGVNFDDLTRVNSAAPNGTSSLSLYYSTVDPNPYSGTTWYRLRQTDLDGNSTWSSVVSVDFSKTGALSVYPNPSTGIVYIDGLGNNQSMVNVQWFDLGGRLLLQQTAAIAGGTTRLTTHFNNGVYILKFQTADGTIITKTILMMK